MQPAGARPPVVWDVVGVGANAVDLVSVVAEYPTRVGPSSKIRVRRQFVSCGGQTANAMATCARLGLRAAYVGAVGSDHHGRLLREALAARAVDTTHLVTRDAKNQFAVIILDEASGERVILWDRDERLLLEPAEVPDGMIQSARLLHVDDVDEGAAIRAARIARGAGVPVTSDIDHLGGRTEELIAAVDVAIFDEYLPARLTGAGNLEDALRLLRHTHTGLLCATRGARGAIAIEEDRICVSPGFKVAAVDTTGAGDVFRGGFIYGRLQGWPMDQVLDFANAAAAISCTRLGAMQGIPALAEVRAMLMTGERTS